jgi:hypothetical protein
MRDVVIATPIHQPPIVAGVVDARDLGVGMFAASIGRFLLVGGVAARKGRSGAQTPPERGRRTDVERSSVIFRTDQPPMGVVGVVLSLPLSRA